MHPPYVNRCWERAGAVDTYQLLLQQDQQLRLLQSQVSEEQGGAMDEGAELMCDVSLDQRLQVQMLLEAQGRFQPCVETVRSTASVAVGTGVSSAAVR